MEVLMLVWLIAIVLGILRVGYIGVKCGEPGMILFPIIVHIVFVALWWNISGGFGDFLVFLHMWMSGWFVLGNLGGVGSTPAVETE